MKKTLKKVLALMLALTVVFSIPVIAGAADYFDFRTVSAEAVSGTWKKDKVETMQLIIHGDGRRFVGSDVIVSVGSGTSTTNVATFKKDDVKVSFSGDKTVIEFNLNKTLSHGTTYNFEIKEGTFATGTGKLNAAYVYSTTGNLIIETLEVTPLDIPANPLEQLVRDMERSDYAWLLKPLILIMKWFMSL